MSVAATSLAAGRTLRGAPAKNMRAQVLKYILKCSRTGATLDEIAEYTGIRLQTVCARRNELGKKGLVVDSGRRRATSSGRSAVVWVIPERVVEAIERRGAW